MVLDCTEEEYEAWLSGLKPSEENLIFGKGNYRFVLVQGRWLLFVLKDAKQTENEVKP
jgi:hypothetical protein